MSMRLKPLDVPALTLVLSHEHAGEGTGHHLAQGIGSIASHVLRIV
jgi:hypothetical protein